MKKAVRPKFHKVLRKHMLQKPKPMLTDDMKASVRIPSNVSFHCSCHVKFTDKQHMFCGCKNILQQRSKQQQQYHQYLQVMSPVHICLVFCCCFFCMHLNIVNYGWIVQTWTMKVPPCQGHTHVNHANIDQKLVFRIPYVSLIP